MEFLKATSSFLLALWLILEIVSASESESAIRLSPDSDMTYEEEYKMFEAEEETANVHLNRKKRFIYLNVDTNMAVALLVALPLTFILPSMTNLFNNWRRKRSITTEPSMDMFHEHASVKPEVDKLYAYFQLLDIPEPSCQLRAVCEFSADPEKFNPLSEVILRRIRNPHLPARVYLEGNNNDAFPKNSSSDVDRSTSLFDLYNQAADDGQAYGNEKCLQRYASACQYPIEKLLNMPVLQFWNALQSVLKLTFKDVAMK